MLCLDFLKHFEDKSMRSDPIHGRLKYMIQMVSPPFNLVATGGKPWYTNHRDSHRRHWGILYVQRPLFWPCHRREEDRQFVDELFINTKRFVLLFSQAIDSLMPERLTPITEDESQSAEAILAQQRRANAEITDPSKLDRPKANLPAELTRN